MLRTFSAHNFQAVTKRITTDPRGDHPRRKHAHIQEAPVGLAWLSLPLARTPGCHLNSPPSTQTRQKSRELPPSRHVWSPRGTYGYPQDGCLHRGPFVLPSVYDQDESNASILQTETRRNTRSQHMLAADRASTDTGDPTVPCHLHTTCHSACPREVSAAPGFQRPERPHPVIPRTFF